jgi:hypothetical protein
MNSEYYFFDEGLAGRFAAMAQSRGVQHTLVTDPVGGYNVVVPDGLSQEVTDALEDLYEHLTEEQRDLIDATDGEAGIDLMGVTVQGLNNEPCVVRLPAAYGRRLVAHFSFEEIHELVQLIAHNVVHPTQEPLCRKAQA